MSPEWSLDILYKGFDDPQFAADFETLKEKVEEVKVFVDKLPLLEREEGILGIIERSEAFTLLARKIGSYISLRSSTNTTDVTATAYSEKLNKMMSSIKKENTIMDKYIVQTENLWEIVEKYEQLQAYRFYFEELQNEAKYMLSDEVEAVISKLNLSAGAAWSKLQSYLTSTVKVEYAGEQTTLAGIRNLAYSAEKETRKTAYEAELAAYDKIKDGVAFSLNNIKSQVNTICELRGYTSALEKTLSDSRMKKETLDAMFTAMQEYLPKFWEYLKAKAAYLGYEGGLPWYELFAPVGESNKTYSLEEAKDYLVSHFKTFAKDLAEMVERAFDEEWIDFYPHAGKVGGAFCSNLPFVKQSRVLTNYDGSFSDIVTLAHELGHAYHGQQIQEHRPLNLHYTMPVAETASTFNETVIMNAAIAEADDAEKIALIESQLQDTTQIICDIYSRFLFESAVFEQRKEKFMFPDELCRIMTDAQKKAYGDGLAEETLHPYMWVCKSHYYRDSLSFYNFPYAFGGLFARGLYAQYQKEGEAFLPKYRALLKATTVSTVEEVAAMADIDITNADFWRAGLASVAEQIDLFVALTNK